MAKCNICGKEIVLVPSAEERARKFGGKAQDYIKMFTSHSECIINKRREETSKLIKNIEPSC